MISQVHSKKGDIRSEIEALKKSVQCDRDHPVAHNNLAHALGKVGEIDDAIAEWEEVIRLKPQDASAHNAVGALYVNSERPDAALPYLKQALILNEDYALAYVTREFPNAELVDPHLPSGDDFTGACG